MKIEFDKKGNDFIEIRQEGDNVVIILSSQDINNVRSSIINSVEIRKDQFEKLISEIEF